LLLFAGSGLQLYIVRAQSVNELEAALTAAKDQRADALVEAHAVSSAPLLRRIIEFAAKTGCP
jgi:hypothetical protein